MVWICTPEWLVWLAFAAVAAYLVVDVAQIWTRWRLRGRIKTKVRNG